MTLKENMFDPTIEQLNSVCMSFNHSFGLMTEEEQKRMRWEAKEWLYAWYKEFFEYGEYE